MQHLKVVTLAHAQRALFLPKDFDQLPQLHSLELKDIVDFNPIAWQSLKDTTTLKKLTVEAKKYPLALGVFELTQIKELTLEGMNLSLDVPIENLINLEKLEIKKSSTDGAISFFEKLKKNTKLKTIQFHHELDQLYQSYLSN